MHNKLVTQALLIFLNVHHTHELKLFHILYDICFLLAEKLEGVEVGSGRGIANIGLDDDLLS